MYANTAAAAAHSTPKTVQAIRTPPGLSSGSPGALITAATSTADATTVAPAAAQHRPVVGAGRAATRKDTKASTRATTVPPATSADWRLDMGLPLPVRSMGLRSGTPKCGQRPVAPTPVDEQLPGAMAEPRERAGFPSLRQLADRLAETGRPLARTTIHRALRDPHSNPDGALAVAELLADQLPAHERQRVETTLLAPLRSLRNSSVHGSRSRSGAGTPRTGAWDDADGAGFERVPPQDLDAEQSVLGAMLLSKDAITDVATILEKRDFCRPAHETIYQAVLDLDAQGEPADPITLAAALDRRGDLDRAGGAAYLHLLVQVLPTAAHVEYYAEIVHERAVLRRLAEAGAHIAQMAYAGGGDLEDMVRAAHAAIDAAVEPGQTDTPKAAQ